MRTRIIGIRWLRRPVTALATLALATGTVAALAGSAAQAAPSSGLTAGVTVVTSPPSASDSVSPKFATATCPPGTTVIGAGGDISGGDGKVALEQVQPDLNTRSVQVTAADTDPNPLTWSVVAKAICAPPPSGLTEKVWESASTSDDKERTVDCPAGLTLLGFGYDVLGADGRVVVTKIAPNGNAFVPATSLTVGAHEEDGTAVNWRLVVKLLCADYIANQQVLTFPSPVDSARAKSQETADCPGNQYATAGGVEVVPLTTGLDNRFAVTSILPVAPNLVPGLPETPQKIRATVYKEDPTSTDWVMYVTVLCA